MNPEKEHPGEQEFTSEFADALSDAEQPEAAEEQQEAVEALDEALDADMAERLGAEEEGENVSKWKQLLTRAQEDKWGAATAAGWAGASAAQLGYSVEAFSQQRWAEGALVAAFSLASLGLSRRGWKNMSKENV